MKISLITVVRNGEAFLEDCFKSIIAQDYRDIEHIVIDGGSTDRTMLIIEEYKKYIDVVLSEKDEGLYDAVNKGISLASGEVIGLLNADDMLAEETIITSVSSLFEKDTELQAVYGDLDYVHPTSLKVIRKWRSKQGETKDLINGWMPAHPTLYIKKSAYMQYGNYALNLGTAADYELILRYFYLYKIKTRYLPLLIVNMRTGGLSNSSLIGMIKAAKNDFIALKRNKVPLPFLALIKKKMNKLEQFCHHVRE